MRIPLMHGREEYTYILRGMPMAHARQELMRYNLKIPATTGPCSAMVVKALVLPRISNIEDHANACIVVRHGRQRIEVLQAAEMDKKKWIKTRKLIWQRC